MTKKVPESFEKAAASLFGYNGGNAESPIWLCALEWGGGWDEANPQPPDFCDDQYDADKWSICPECIDMFRRGIFANGQQRGSLSFYRTQISLLRAIIAKPEDKGTWDKEDAKKWITDFKFFSKGRYGLSLNAFYVSMKGRQKTEKHKSAEDCWKEDKVLRLSDNPINDVSFAKWTDIGSFREFKDWCVEKRRKAFSAFRREYHPAVIYCGGLSEENRLFDIWTDEMDSKVERKPLECKSVKGSYCWLDNGPDRNPTLLAVGLFFGGQPGTMNSYDQCWELGQELRKLCNEKFNDGGEWLQEKKFMTQESIGFVCKECGKQIR